MGSSLAALGFLMGGTHYRDLRILNETLGVLAYLSGSLPVPQRTFLRDLTLGILCARSCQLSEIARALVSSWQLESEYHRLDRLLGYYDLSPAYERAQRLMLSEIDSFHLFIFDPSEVVKRFAKKMEALAIVRDGSEPPRRIYDLAAGKWKEQPVLRPGYSLRVAVAMDRSGELLPVELSLYSTAEEGFISTPDENIQVIDSLLQQTNFAPTLVLDQEFDSFSVFRHLMQLRQKFVIRVGPDRKYFRVDEPRSPTQQTFTREEMIEKHCILASQNVIPFTRSAGETRPTLCRFRAARVKLLSESKRDEAFRAEGEDPDALYLVQLKLHKIKGIPTLYLLTSLRPLTEAELQAVGVAYLARWNIEEYVRFLKQHFELEKFLVRDLGRMRNLVRAVFLATVLMHVITDSRKPYFRGKRNHWHLLNQALPVNSKSDDRKHRDFFLYAYGRGLSQIVMRNRDLLRTLNPKPGRPKNKAA